MRIMSDKSITREEVASQIETAFRQTNSRAQASFYLAVGAVCMSAASLICAIIVFIK
jgi:hypothetical protein